jgi:putative transposase
MGGQIVTTQEEADQRRRVEQAREIALFRYSLIQEVISSQLTPAQRGRRVRQLAAAVHPGPGGQQVRVSYQSINRWKRDYLAGGFEALVPAPRQPAPRTPAEVLELAAALKRENPERTAAQVQRILRATSGWAPSDRTLQRLFERLELNRRAADDNGQQRVFGRFEADRPNELWTGDALHGPVIGGRKTYLFCFIDDHSRAVMGARWAFHEDVVRLAAALRPALAVRGSRNRSTSTTVRRSSTRGYCAPARCWASSWSTASREGLRGGGRWRGSSAPSVTSSWSRSPHRTAARRQPGPRSRT